MESGSVSVTVKLFAALREALGERGWLGWLGSGWHSLGSCGIVLSTIVLGAGLWNGFQAERRAKKKERSTGGSSAAEEEVDHRVDGPHKPPAGGNDRGSDSLSHTKPSQAKSNPKPSKPSSKESAH